MKYLKLFEQLKDDIITNKYNIWVSQDEKYVIYGDIGQNYEANHPSAEGEGFTYDYYPVFPIEMLDKHMFDFSHIPLTFDKAKDLDMWLMMRESNIGRIPNVPRRDGYEQMELTIKDFKEVRYVEGVFLDKGLNI